MLNRQVSGLWGETLQCVGDVHRSSPLWAQLCFLWVCRYACCAQRPDSDKRPCSQDPWLTQLWQIVSLVLLSSLLSTLGVNFFGKQLDWMGKCLASFERVFGRNIFKQMFAQLFRLSVLTFFCKIFFCHLDELLTWFFFTEREEVCRNLDYM